MAGQAPEDTIPNPGQDSRFAGLIEIPWARTSASGKLVITSRV